MVDPSAGDANSQANYKYGVDCRSKKKRFK